MTREEIIRELAVVSMTYGFGTLLTNKDDGVHEVPVTHAWTSFIEGADVYDLPAHDWQSQHIGRYVILASEKAESYTYQEFQWRI